MSSVIAAPALVGPWVDTSWKCTPGTAAALRSAGQLGVGRYVNLPNNSSHGDISGMELGCLLDAGLQVLLVQHPRRPIWLPSEHRGADDGREAATSAHQAGYPEGAHLFMDLEGAGGPADVCSQFCNDWSRVVTAEGFRAGLYVGFSALLNAQQLYDLPYFTCYWSDFGPREVAVRGFAIKQGAPSVTIAGVEFDPDVVHADQHGDLPYVATAA